MTNPRRGAKRPPAAPHAPSFPETALIVAEARAVREMLLRAGIRRPDLDDVMQETIIGAVVAVRRGRYRPNPAIEPRFAMRRWLVGIAFNQLSHLHRKAHRRWEMLTDETVEPAEAAPSLGWCCILLRSDQRFRALARQSAAPPSLEAYVIAWETLRVLSLLPRWARDVLLLVALGSGPVEIARIRGIPTGTAMSRILYARRKLAALLARRER